MIEEGDIGFVFSMFGKWEGLGECGVDENGDSIGEDFCSLVNDGLVVYKSEEDCRNEFGEMVGELDGELLELFNNYMRVLRKENEKRNNVKWFVGSDGEYISKIGFEFEVESENDFDGWKCDNELLMDEWFGYDEDDEDDGEGFSWSDLVVVKIDE